MRLHEWVACHPRGELARLARDTGLTRNTLWYLAREVRPAKYETAALISRATNGAVSVDELCAPRPRPRPRLRRKKKA